MTVQHIIENIKEFVFIYIIFIIFLSAQGHIIHEFPHVINSVVLKPPSLLLVIMNEYSC